MNSPVEIKDGFRELSPSERSEATASFLSQFADHMRDNNKRILSRILDMIAETEGDEKLHLDMLATHLEMETSEILAVRRWDMPEVTSIDEYRAQSRLGDDSGICPRMTGSNDYTTQFLSSLGAAVRENASRDLLGSTADTLELPAEFCEFLRHTSGVAYPNLDRQMFVCSFATALYDAAKQAQPLDKMCEFAGSEGFEVAAGWKAGDNDQNCCIHYFLCKDLDEPDAPWQWRIFIHNSDFHDSGYYDSLHEFLSWYCKPYDWVDWDTVRHGVDALHQRCQEATSEDEEQSSNEDSD